MKLWCALVAAVLVTSGCATARLVDSQVQSFAPMSIEPGSRYRFERLPSQNTPAQDQLEQLAKSALSKVGLQWGGENAALLIQVQGGTLMQKQRSPNHLDLRLGWMFSRGGLSLHQQDIWADLHTQTVYLRQVSVVIRDASGRAVRYETQASHQGIWSDDAAIFGALFDAALDGFPKASNGARRVNITIPR